MRPTSEQTRIDAPALRPGPTRGARPSDRVDLGDFLRRRREALRPGDVGLVPGTRRRTPGLRRDEVAALANMSVDYYERLERARGPQPSASLLAGIATALRLTAAERDHLYLLAGQAPPVTAPPVSIEVVEAVDPGLQYVLDTMAATTPGYVSDDLSTILAQNPLNVALFGPFAGLPGREANLIWRWFTSPQWRSLLCPLSDEEPTGRSYVADLRATVAQRGHDRASTALVADLRAASAEFARMWDEHEVATLACLTKVVDDEQVGRLDLDCVIILSITSTQRLMLMQPTPGTATAERLARLQQLIASPR